ncbi:hypothetical protein [Candidatus Absconditicoccus praedator]|uniref:hypothetical protein n=1 Tax=Candidatus Absconditicoccus praedator TaxID=2735562 RepID=UPI001E2A7DE2|nr:hypothetical protein [Candidatus Absconditicoccus praedator]UFX83371.1 hypothetical protein HLG78_04550 [Candidatus Absconditicoccus praedator]
MKKNIFVLIFFVVSGFLVWIFQTFFFDAENIDFMGYEVNNFFGISYNDLFHLSYLEPKYMREGDVILDYFEFCKDNDSLCSVFPHQSFYADLTWINSVQYIGGNARLHPNIKFKMIDNITNLDPYWNYVYNFGQLTIPENELLSRYDENIQYQSWKDSIKLGEKGINFNCDNDTIEFVESLSNKDYYSVYSRLEMEYPQYANPCVDHKLPFYQGFNYYNYLDEYIPASKNFMLASFNDDVPGIASSMVSILHGRYGEYLQSMHLWYTYFVSILDQLDGQEEETLEESAQNALDRAVGQLQFHILSQSSEKTDEDCAKEYECLKQEGYIKDTISSIIGECGDQYDILDNYTDPQDVISDSKCFVLSYGIDNGYIDNNTGYLISPMNEEFEFVRDEDVGGWWTQSVISDAFEHQ